MKDYSNTNYSYTNGNDDCDERLFREVEVQEREESEKASENCLQWSVSIMLPMVVMMMVMMMMVMMT